jgi:hypothetical protein
MSVIVWVAPEDCDPPHGLDMASNHDADKVAGLAAGFAKVGFDRKAPALVGYPLAGRIQLLSGTHRHLAALLTGVRLPVVLWLSSDIKRAWGHLEQWLRVMEDIPVEILESWTRDELLVGSTNWPDPREETRALFHRLFSQGDEVGPG